MNRMKALATLEALAYMNAKDLMQIALAESDEFIQSHHGGEMHLLQEIREYLRIGEIAQDLQKSGRELCDIPEKSVRRTDNDH